MKTPTAVAENSALTTQATPASAGLLDLRAFTVLVVAFGVALIAGLAAGLYAASQAAVDVVPTGVLSGLAAFFVSFFATAAGANSLIRQ